MDTIVNNVSQTFHGKCAWGFVVSLGFLTAGYLIGKSYLKWQESPISTSSTTRMISMLDFPTVTVCPPMGSTTALNYDLLKAENQSLSDKDRENLKVNIFEIFLQSSHESYATSMLDVVNADNVDLVFNGSQSVPSQYGQNGFETLVLGSNGTIQTPKFEESYDEGFFKDDKLYHMVLEIPDDLKDEMLGGTLVIELEVDIRQVKGWKEEVLYMEGHGYNFYKSLKTWDDARTSCESKGMKLATVNSKWEQEQVDRITPGNDEAWLGGTDSDQEGEWKWIDGSPVTFTKWMSLSSTSGKTFGSSGTGFDCIVNTRKSFNFAGHLVVLDEDYWRDDTTCTQRKGFVCQEETNAVQGRHKLIRRYTREQLTFPVFQVWYKLKAAKQSQLDVWKDKRMTGCRLSWRVENSPLTLTSSEVGRTIETPNLGSSNFETSYFEEDHSFIATLEIQTSLKTQLDDGALVIQLETNLHEGEGWVETVTYTGVSKEFVLVDDKKTWEEAEVYCQNQGGHLASIITEREENEAFYLSIGDFDYTFFSYADSQIVWIGGTDKDKEGSDF